MSLGLVLYALLDLVPSRASGPRRSRLFAGYALVGAVTLLLAAPQLRGYLEMSRRYGASLTAESFLGIVAAAHEALEA